MLKIILSLAILFSFSFATNFTKRATIKPVLVQKGKAKNWCAICGMNLKMFYKTSYSVKLKNGKNRQYCSIRCLVVDMQKNDIDKSSIAVVDAKTQKLINAKDAFFVVGSKIKGTMSKVSKLAFKKKIDAKDFIKRFGGKLVDFDTALNMAKKSLNKDIAMTNKKKQKKIYPMGKKIFKKACKKNIDLKKYLQINELKSTLKFQQICKPLKEKQLQAVALYLWEVKRVGKTNDATKKIQVTKKEKCPVCGMFVYKYPRWVAQIFYKHEAHEHHLSFDGVKDMMKFYLAPSKWGEYSNIKQNITKILVTDYYSQKSIDAKKALYVIGSDVYGPMGEELIPFKNINDATTFKQDHFGEKIIKFGDIKEDIF